MDGNARLRLDASFAPRPFSVDASLDRDVLVAEVSGELDLATLPVLRAAVDAFKSDGLPVIFDLQNLQFIDCGGVGCLLSVFGDEIKSGEVSIRHPSPAVRRLLEILDMQHLIESPDIEDQSSR